MRRTGLLSASGWAPAQPARIMRETAIALALTIAGQAVGGHLPSGPELHRFDGTTRPRPGIASAAPSCRWHSACGDTRPHLRLNHGQAWFDHVCIFIATPATLLSLRRSLTAVPAGHAQGLWIPGSTPDFGLVPVGAIYDHFGPGDKLSEITPSVPGLLSLWVDCPQCTRHTAQIMGYIEVKRRKSLLFHI